MQAASTQAAILADGRLHLQHGPIDCLVRAWGEASEIDQAQRQAAASFQGVLAGLCAELAALRRALPSPPPSGDVARAMHRAVAPYMRHRITPMAAVAGAVADHVLAALVAGRVLDRAFVNNGGDIAFHLAPGATLACGLVADLAAPSLGGRFMLRADHPARGLATSGRACKGRGGRSFSLGIADSVSVLARTAAEADAAATVIGNAVDLPGHRAVARRPACDIDPDSDLGPRLVTWEVGPLAPDDIETALDAGRARADGLCAAGRISGAVLCLRGRVVVCGIAALECA